VCASCRTSDIWNTSMCRLAGEDAASRATSSSSVVTKAHSPSRSLGRRLVASTFRTGSYAVYFDCLQHPISFYKQHTPHAHYSQHTNNMTRMAKEDTHITSYWREAKTEGSPIGRSGLKTVHSWPVLSHTPFPWVNGSGNVRNFGLHGAKIEDEERRDGLPPRRGPARASLSPFLKCFRSACES
jgi:hypothetical protein